jgi:hypothetical protein
VASFTRACALLLFALAACGNKPGPEDPAIAVGTGIPMGAPNATGARFDPPSGRGAVASDDGPGQAPLPLPKPLPPDPFDPLETPPPKGHVEGVIPPAPPAPPKPPKKGMQL